jgi:uncharacterized membrane protein
MSTVNGFPTMYIALIAAGGTFGLIGLVVLIAVLMDIPRRMKRNNTSSTEEEERKSMQVDVSEAEKGHSKPIIHETSNMFVSNPSRS